MEKAQALQSDRQSSAWFIAQDSGKLFRLSESIIRFSSIIIVSKWGIIGMWGMAIFLNEAVLRIAGQFLLLYLTYFSLLNTRTCPLPASPQESAHLILDVPEKAVAQLVDRSTEWTITIPLPAGKFNLEHFPGSFEKTKRQLREYVEVRETWAPSQLCQ